MFHVPLDGIGEVTAALHAVHTTRQFMELVSLYGLPRTHPAMRENFQWFVDHVRRNRPVEAGIYDMNRDKKVVDMTADETGT